MQTNDECNESMKKIESAGQEGYYLSGLLFVKGWKTMKIKKNMKRIVSGLLAAVTILTNVVSPVAVYAAETDQRAMPPAYEEVKDQLDEDEIVTAHDYVIETGSDFDVKNDFTGIDILDDNKVKVIFNEAKNADGDNFSTDHADTYRAVYYVEPKTTDHPAYRISRNLLVKEPEAADKSVEAESESRGEDVVQAEDVPDGEGKRLQAEEVSSSEEKGAQVEEASGDKENSLQAEEQGHDSEDVPQTGSIAEEKFDKAIEEAEGQDTVDEESGLSLSDVMMQAAEKEVDLFAMEEGESITFLASTDDNTGNLSVDVTRGTRYDYADYELGSYLTYKYTVEFGSVSATAYCVQPSREGPGDGKYSIKKLSDGKTLAKVCYYGTKASGDEGFFAEKYPDFSAGKRFIITHLAAAYANGSSDAFSGTNATGRKLAMELYDYCVEQPDIPDVPMSFSDGDVTAYVDGECQRTKEITFKADELQTITMKLPDGVKFHNVTTGKTSAAGVSVEVCGGTKFYLSAPLTQAEDVNESWSATMRGSITKDFSAYKITTGKDTQDLALVFGEGVDDEKYVDFKVSWIKTAMIEIMKKDDETATGLAGAVYGLYRDEACTDLIARMPATDDRGVSSLQIIKTQDTVYLKEITAPKGYLIDVEAYGVELVAGSTAEKNVTDRRVNATIHLAKKDKETGNGPQGDATFEGAVYGLYAREDIVHPDGKSGVQYKAGTQVTTLTTDAEGKAEVGNLYYGKYYVKEITPPAGYLLDTTEHDLDCSYTGDHVETVERTATSQEQVVKQPFQIIKAANNGKTDADLLSGAGFSAYLVSSLRKNANGTYDFASAAPVVLTADGKTEMFTDEKGYACSIPIPYGTYIVRETTTPHNFTPVKDFLVTITENKTEPQVWRVLLDDEFEAKLKIIKKDDETKQPILSPDTEFKVYDLDNKKYVEQVTTYPTTIVHTSYFTNEEGYLILPENLLPGNYRIEEVTAPEGYTLNTNYVPIKVDANTAYQMDQISGDAIIEVAYENHPAKGELIIWKEGEVLRGFDGDFQYQMADLAGAVFNVYAAEDIYTTDCQIDGSGNRRLEYATGTLVETVTTDAEGKATVENLPLGKYCIKEVTAPEGYVLQASSQEVEFIYAGQDNPVISEEITFANDRQKVRIAVEKRDGESGAVLAGAEFGLYNAEDIVSGDEVIAAVDTLLETVSSDENGQAVFTLDLPFGQYYVEELAAPAGFVSSDETLEFEFSYQGQDIPVVELQEIKENESTTIEVTKSDITTGVELSGASLSVLDKEGNVVDSWVSVKDEPHVIKRLTAGETYTLRESFAPFGYLKTTDITFMVEDTAEVQLVEMEDEVPTATLIVNKKGEFLDSVTLLSRIKGVVEHIFNYITGNLTDVTFEIYAAEDIKAADGASDDYYQADELVGTITTDELGVARVENLPVGKYYVVETGTAYGYVLDEEPRYVDLSYRDQDTPVVVYDEDWQNNRQTAEISVLKREKDSDRVLAGAIFGLFTKEDILSASGEILFEADTIIELKSTDEEGRITFIADLPVGGSYYVKELYAPDGFVTSEEEKEFTFEYQGDDIAEMVYAFVFENEPTTVEITKTDLTTGEELPGAGLQVLDEDGKVVDEWVSEKEPHVIKELTVGKAYTLVETKPADGYVTAESVEFVIGDTVEIQKVEMQDDVTKVEVSKTDITGKKELPGAKLAILDPDGNVVESWVSTDEAHYIEKLPVGTYTLHEEQAPEGYLVAEDITFTVEDTAEIQKVVMKDEVKPTDVPKTGDETNLWLPVALMMLSAAGLLGFVAANRKKRKNG